MEAKQTQLIDFLGTTKKIFRIPVYQRNYDWKKEQCQKLFQDIEKSANNSTNRTHFMGTMVYVISDASMNFTEYSLIDGQQRITSIALFLKALYDSVEDESVKEDILETYLINKRQTDDSLYIKLQLIEKDMVSYRNLLYNKKDQKNDSNIWKNYQYFMNWIRNSAVEPKLLYETLGKIDLVYIQLKTEEENPQMIFESLNSTGLSLTGADLIRNFLLMNCSSKDQKNFYENYWLKIEEVLTYHKISDFVRDYLTMKNGVICNKDKIYEVFKELHYVFNSNNDNIETLLKELLRFAKYYSYFLYANSENKKVNVYLEQFVDLKTTTANAFFLYIFDECYEYNRISEDELIDILKIIITYVFRRYICDYKTNGFNSLFLNLINGLRQYKGLNNCVDYIGFILVNKNKADKFPRNNEFRENFVNRKIYKQKNDKYLLHQLEYHFSKEVVFLGETITIEHIMPQTLNQIWKKQLGDNFKEIHTQYLDTIGNLTLTGYNSELGNKSFQDKREQYKDSNIKMCRDVSEYEIWNQESIMDRADKLFELALKIWVFPEQYEKTGDNVEGIEYRRKYQIVEDIDVKGEKIENFVVLDMEYVVSTWINFLKILCDSLHDLDKSILYQLIRHKNFTGRERVIINDNAKDMKKPYKIDENLYIEMNLSANDILHYAKLICEHFDVSDDVFFVLKGK